MAESDAGTAEKKEIPILPFLRLGENPGDDAYLCVRK